MNWRRAVAAVLALAAAWEIARSLGRLDGVVFTGYTQVGEVVLQGGDPYGLPINTWPPFFLFLAACLTPHAYRHLSNTPLFSSSTK